MEPAHAPDEKERQSGKELEEIVEKVLSELNENYRKAIVLCDIEGMKRSEAAEAVGVSIDTVGSWLFRGRKKFHKLLKEKVNISGDE